MRPSAPPATVEVTTKCGAPAIGRSPSASAWASTVPADIGRMLLTSKAAAPFIGCATRLASTPDTACMSSISAWSSGKPITTQPISAGARIGTITNW